MLAVPRVVQNKARTAGSHRWLAELADLVGDLEHEWGITVGSPYEDASEAFVARAVCGDGSRAVLKLVVPQGHDGARREITALELAGGDGCVRLLRADAERGALLLEQLGPSLARSRFGSARRQEILVGLARRIWRPASGTGLPTGREKGRRLSDFIVRTWEALDRPCTETAMAYARSCAEERARAHDDERSVLVHGDVHQWNALLSADGYKLVDPDGLLAEPEYDLGVIMREDPVELAGDGRGRSRWLARVTGLDEQAIWQWGAAERMSTGLLLVKIGLQPVGDQMLAAAERVTPRSFPAG